MGTSVEIPGGTAVLRDQHELKVRHRRLIEAASLGAAGVMAKLPADLPDDPEELAKVRLDSLSLTRQEAGALLELQDATIVALLASWTLPDKLPDMDTIGDMTPEVYDALAEATRARGAKIAQAVDTGPDPDPKAPGSDSSNSDGPSKADETPESPES